MKYFFIGFFTALFCFGICALFDLAPINNKTTCLIVVSLLSGMGFGAYIQKNNE